MMSAAGVWSYRGEMVVGRESKEELLDGNSSDLEKESMNTKEEESDCDTMKDSVSSQGDLLTTEEQKLDGVRNPKQPKNVKKNASETRPHSSAGRFDRQTKSSQSKAASKNVKNSIKSNGKPSKLAAKKLADSNSKAMKAPPKPSSESSEGVDDKPVEEMKEIEKEIDCLNQASNGTHRVMSDEKGIDCLDQSSNGAQRVVSDEKEIDCLDKSSNGAQRVVSDEKEIDCLDQSSNGAQSAASDEKERDCLDQSSNGAQSVASDDETNDAEEAGEDGNEEVLLQKIKEMENKVDKLEEELREVAALEIALYSVVPEHGSSAHKVHTPARRLSRLYIHACKHWTQDRRATIAKNTVSGLVLVARSCGNDVPRLTFWLSNTVVLREIISQAFGNSHNSSPLTRYVGLNGVRRISDGKSLKWKGAELNKPGFMPFLDDWQETGTLTTALEKVESWIFCRILESVWWQTLAPNMQSPANNNSTNKSTGKLSGPALGDHKQGNFSVNLWKSAFQDAFQRLCPVRAGGHECGCLPVLARMVMEQCVARLDVAMFNAILRESEHEIPTDPISDPIVDPKVLPIPAGNLSFGSGAQLKNTIGNWSRWLTDSFGMDTDDSLMEEQLGSEDDDRESGDIEPKSFHLLNDLSDLLMLPKDMLIDHSIRKEVCPSIGLSLLKRILCNFTPDEFCPDPVPGVVLEAVNAESIVERRLSGELSSFPCPASPVVYVPPSPADVSQKVAEAGWKPQLERNVSHVQKKGYTSDEELEELDSPLPSIIDKSPRPSTETVVNGNKIGNGYRNGNGIRREHTGYTGANARYELLREVWSA